MKHESVRTLLLSLLFALVFPSLAHCYYNPSTGRWLSRDPIAERGGLNVYAFVGDAPCGRTDYLGQSDDEYFKWTSFPLNPRAGTPERTGETWETATGGEKPEPIKHRAPKSSVNCCHKVHVSSEWGAAGWYDPGEANSKEHEGGHYTRIHSAYISFIAKVKTFDRQCMNGAARDCFAATVGTIAAAAQHESRYNNFQFDCDTYRRYCDEAENEQGKTEAAWQLVDEALQRCEKLRGSP